MARPSAGERPYGPDYLYQVIDVISSGPDLETILRGFVALVTEATECHGCFVYFLEETRLVLRAASSGYAHLEGQLHLAMEQGLAGWVARTRHSAFIKDHALDDPRVVYVPELEEERYQSLVAVPIVARAGEVIGVITLHARAPHEFRKTDLEFLEHSASLIAGAIENARLYEQATQRVVLLIESAKLAQQIAAAASLDELLPLVVNGCRALLGASRCELHLVGADGCMQQAAASPPRPKGAKLAARRLWAAILEGGGDDSESRALAETIWGKREGRATPLFAPLTAGPDRLGLIAALVERADGDRRNVLAAVASHTAVAIRRQQLIDALKVENQVKDFFEALARGEGAEEELRTQAARLTFDMDEPHLVLEALPWSPPRPPARPPPRAAGPGRTLDWRELANRLESRLRAEFPRSLFDRRQTGMRALLRLPAAGPDAALRSVRDGYAALGGGESGPLAVGVSNPCRGAGSFASGFHEARNAVEVGALLHGRAGVFRYEDLGVYRYVLTGDSRVPDRYQDALEHLVQYERRRGTALIRTLEAYLEHQGAIAATSRALYMHPNTLRQRLSRIEQLTHLDLNSEDWLSLAMAIKAVKLRVIRDASRLTSSSTREERA